jgi:hypothetical protein
LFGCDAVNLAGVCLAWSRNNDRVMCCIIRHVLYRASYVYGFALIQFYGPTTYRPIW